MAMANWTKTGTFCLADMVGLDIVSAVSQNIVDNSHDPSEEAEFALPAVHHELLALGHLGDKTKQGYYKRVKTDKGPVSYAWDTQAKDYAPLEVGSLSAVQRAASCKSLDEKLRNLVYAPEADGKAAWVLIKSMLLYVARKADEISYSYQDIDTAMRCGYNWIYGPFRIWDAIGLEKSVARMKEEGDEIPAWIEAKLQSGNTTFMDPVSGPNILFAGKEPELVKENSDAALYHIGDDVLRLKFKTKANTVSVGVADMLQEAVRIAEHGYAGLVIANDGKHFSVGADLSSATEAMRKQDWSAMATLADSLQQANMALKYCKHPVVAVPFGQTLGGGCEIVMHASAAVASAETCIGLTEVGVGLVPSGGGLTQLLVRYMDHASKGPKADPNDFVLAAWETVAMRKLSSSAHEGVKLGYLRPTDRILLANESLLQQAKDTVLYMSEAYRPPIKKSLKLTGATGRAAIQYIFCNSKNGGFISEYDAFLMDKVAYVLSGGDAPTGTVVTEEHILQLEKETFLELLKQEKTMERIEYMLKNGKLLNN